MSSFAAFASAVMPAGVMSDVPTIASREMLLLTVERPFTPITIATTPNAIRTAPATSPPISNTLRISELPFVCGRPRRGPTFNQESAAICRGCHREQPGTDFRVTAALGCGDLLSARAEPERVEFLGELGSEIGKRL